MKSYDLDSAFPHTPQVFSERIDQTLRQIKEEKPMRKITLRAVLMAALITLLVAGAAYAVINLGQEWYFGTRFTAYQEHEPEKHQAIMENLQTDIIQENSGEAAGWVNLKVQDAAWAKEQKVLTLSFAASALSPDKEEMYALGELDQDGLWTAQPDPEDPEARLEHWLFTSQKHGLPQDVMNDPNKRLLLIDVMTDVHIGTSDVAMPMWMTDTFTSPEGPVITIQEYDLSQLEDAEIRKNYENRSTPEGWSQADYEQYLRKEEAGLLARAEDIRQAIAQATDANGYLPLRMPYKVWFFDLEKNDMGEGVDGEITFKVKVP